MHWPKQRHHEFAFAGGLLRRAYDDCLITAEIKKQRYIYYHCTGEQGKCELPHFREQELSQRLGGILKDIYVPESVVADIQESLVTEKVSRANRLRAEETRLQQRLSAIRTRMDQAYLDKLDGKIALNFGSARTRNGSRKNSRCSLRLPL